MTSFVTSSVGSEKAAIPMKKNTLPAFAAKKANTPVKKSPSSFVGSNYEFIWLLRLYDRLMATEVCSLHSGSTGSDLHSPIWKTYVITLPIQARSHRVR